MDIDALIEIQDLRFAANIFLDFIECNELDEGRIEGFENLAYTHKSLPRAICIAALMALDAMKDK